MTPLKLALSFLGALLLAMASHAPAALAAGSTRTWTGHGGDGLWSTVANWDTGVPVAGDSVFFTSACTVHTNNDLSLTGASSLVNVTFQSGTTGCFITGNGVGFTGSLSAAGTGSNQIDAALSGTGSISMTGGLLTLSNPSNNNSYSGGTTISAGSISTASGDLGTGTVTLAGGSLQGNGVTSTLTNAVTVSTASSIGGSVSLQLSGTISGAGGLTQNMSPSSTTLILGASNTFTGGFTNSAGTTVVANSNALGSIMATFGSSSTLQATGGPFTLANPMTFNSNTNISGTSDFTLSGLITAAGGFTKAGSNTLTLSGANGSLGGTVVVNGGTLGFSSASALGTATLSLSGGGTLQPTGSITWTNPISVSGLATINVQANTGTANGAISGSGLLNVNGSGGTLTLGAAETYSGAIALTSAILSVSSTGSTPSSGQVLIGSGSCLCLTGATAAQSVGSISGSGSVQLPSSGLTVGGDNSSGAFTGSMTGTGGLTKAGSGILTLQGAQSYTGSTTINGGTLLVTTPLSSSPVSVNSGGILAGATTFGTISVLSGGSLAPALGSGAMSATNLTFATGSNFLATIGGTAVNTINGYTQITVSGTTTLSGANLAVGIVSGFTPSVGQVYTLISGPVTGTFNGIANGGSTTLSGVTYSVAYSSVDLTVTNVATVVATVPVTTPTTIVATSGGGGGGAPAPPPGAILNAPGIPTGLQQTLGNIGLSGVVIPSVPPPGTLAAPADVPVPLATLNAGALVLPLNTSLTPQVLAQIVGNATAPVAVQAAVNPTQGGVIVAGNAAVVISATTFNLPPAAPGQAAPVVQVLIQPPTSLPVPGGPAQFSINGTNLDITFVNQTTGQQITTFNTPIQITLQPNAANVTLSGNHPETLTAAYVIDAQSPAIENPLGFPVGTFVIFPPSNVVNDGKTITVTTQALGSTVAVVTNPVGFVQTTSDAAPVNSSFDPNASQTFGQKPQFSYLQVVEPQIGSRLLVLDPDTGNYGYVNATDVGPSGPPPPKTSSAVVRGLAGPSPKPRAGPPPAVPKR